jgi:hypothetical protein
MDRFMNTPFLWNSGSPPDTTAGTYKRFHLAHSRADHAGRQGFSCQPADAALPVNIYSMPA